MQLKCYFWCVFISKGHLWNLEHLLSQVLPKQWEKSILSLIIHKIW